MKNLKKVLAYAMSVATLGSVALLPINVSADVVLDNSEVYIYESTTSPQEADYQLPNDFDIQSIIEDKNNTIVLDGTKFTLTEICAEISDGMGYNSKHYDITNDVISTIEKENNGKSYYVEFFFKREDNYPYVYILNKNVEDSSHVLQAQALDIAPPPTIGESENKPITEITVGDSTFPRGDINLDGKVNTLDLLMLKKYLLGLMEW